MKNYYECKAMPYANLKEYIELPKFQRSIVWKKSAKEKFIETLKAGFPFGSLLLYKLSEKKYLLIDGLQRFSTIQSFENNPCNYLDLSTIAEKEIKKFIKIISDYKGYELPDAEQTSIQKKFIEICKEYNISDNDNKTIIIGEIIKKILYENNNSQDTLLKLLEIIEDIKKCIKSEINLDALYIPVIIFSGDYSDLPFIYESINASGTKLSKYKIDDLEILEKVEEKYLEMNKKSNISIMNFKDGEIINSKEINLFEYACALGKIIKEKCQDIFGDINKNNSDVDSIGFMLISMCINKNCKINKNLSEIFDRANPSNMIVLKNKIVYCCKEVNNILSSYVRLNSESDPQIKNFPYQMTLIIAILFHINFTINSDLSIYKNPNSKKQKEEFEKNMPFRFLYDYIQDIWGKRSDSERADSRISSGIYSKTISKESWRGALQEFMMEQLNSTSYKRKKVNNLLINYIIKLSNKNDNINYNDFDIEYIIPIATLKKSLKVGAFSDIGNFYCKKKGTHSIADFGFLSPEPSEIHFINNENTFTIENYKLFLKNRHYYLINKFLEFI